MLDLVAPAPTLEQECLAALVAGLTPSETEVTAGAIGPSPQPGPQTLFARTPANIAIIGGSLFGGKTHALVAEPLKHRGVKNFSCVIFRRLMPEHTQPGGPWQESETWYPALGGVPRSHVHEWDFPVSDALVKFAGLEYESSLAAWLGAQICLLEFDQLETFTEKLFFVMLSRNRSTCGVRPYCRASCNPDPDSFLVRFLAWWIDEEGWALPERSGVIRWFVRVHDALEWATTTCAPDDYAAYDAREQEAKAELEARSPGHGDDALSVTFVLARLQDNLIGNAHDPDYIRKVRALPHVEQTRLLGGDRGGNWKVRPTAGKVFNRAWFRTLTALPTDLVALIRYWDKAGTEGGGKYSAGVLMARRASGRYLVIDVERGQWSAGNRETVIRQKATADAAQFGASRVAIWVEQEPGSGGKESAEATVLNLAGHSVHAERVTGDKLTRAGPLSAQAEAGNVDVLAGGWTEAFLAEAQSFDGVRGFMDQIDAAAGAFNKLALQAPMQITRLTGF